MPPKTSKNVLLDHVLAVPEANFRNPINLRLVVDQRGQHSDVYLSSSMLPLSWKLLCDAGNVGHAIKQVTMLDPVVVKNKNSYSNTISTPISNYSTSSNNSEFRSTRL